MPNVTRESGVPVVVEELRVTQRSTDDGPKVRISDAPGTEGWIESRPSDTADLQEWV